jgi:trigger factor
VEVTVHTLSAVAREVEIVATQEDLREHFEKAYEEHRKKIEIRGFRKGKAPLDIVKKMYGDLIEQDSLQEIATALYRQAVLEKELKPIGDPILSDMDYRRGGEFRCKIRYDIRPTITLKDYKGIPVQKVVHTVTESEIEKELDRLRRMGATLETADTATDSEFVVTVTMQDLDPSGTPLIGRRSENIRFYLADDQLEPEFKEALKNASVGMEPRVQFEHAHGDHSHSVNALLTVTKIERVVMPALDDAFVAKVTSNKMATVEELRTNIRKDVQDYWKSKTERQVLNDLIGEILRRHEFEVPESLVRSVLESLAEEVKQDAPDKKLPADFDMEKFFEQNRPYAVAQSRWALLREEIIKAEGLIAEDADLEKLAAQESERVKIDKERLISYYKTSDQIKDRIVGDKLIALLQSSAVITEVPETTPA